MANSEGAFGGNGSVMWRVDVHNAKKPPTSSKKQPNNPGHKGYVQEGADDSQANGKFEVSLRSPAQQGDRDEFAKGLESAAQGIRNGDDWVSFTLVIEDVQSGKKPKMPDEQIRVVWPSFP